MLLTGKGGQGMQETRGSEFQSSSAYGVNKLLSEGEIWHIGSSEASFGDVYTWEPEVKSTYGTVEHRSRRIRWIGDLFCTALSCRPSIPSLRLHWH